MSISPRAAKLTILKGHKILVLGFSPTETAKLESAAVNLGASVFQEYRKDLACVITRCLDNDCEPSDTIRKAIVNQIPVISPRWLVDCSTSKAWNPFDSVDRCYRLSLFDGMIATCSGCNPQEMSLIRNTIESHGGIFDRNLVKGSSSHLIVSMAVGGKYESAMAWGGIVIVTPAWLTACVQAGYWVASESFFPPSSSPPPISSPDTTAAAEPTNTMDTHDHGNDEMDVELHYVNNSEHMPPPLTLPRGRKQPQKQQSPLSLPEIVIMLDTHLISLIALPSSQHALPSPRLVSKMDVFNGQVLFISGHSPVVERYLSALFLQAGGFVAAMLDESIVQYIILGPSLGIVGEEGIRRRVSLMPGLQHANLLWLLDILIPRETWQHLLPPPYNNSSSSSNIGEMIS